MRRLRPLPSTTLSLWLTRMGVDRERPDRRIVDAAADLVETMSDRPQGLAGALYRFGNVLGADGWPIAQVCQWLHLLDDQISCRGRPGLHGCWAHAAVAQGWADGYVRGAHAGICVDPTSGLVTAMVLRLRLAEVYEQCAAASVLPEQLYSMVLVDLDLRDLPTLEADLLLACVAGVLRDFFHGGETIARAGERMLVLAGTSEATEERAEALADRLQLDARTQRARPTVLRDPLPPSADVLDRYLRDLVG